MKNLMICWVLLGLSYTAYAQQTAEQNINISTDELYAVNRNNKADRNRVLQDGDPVRSKKFSRTFAADRGDKINLGNQFGSMIIKTWDRKEVKIDITISAYANNDNEAQELVDQVEINAEKTGDLISCKTEIDRGNRWSGRNKKREIKVNYMVYLPTTNALTLSQQFGNVDLADFSGALSAKVQYGNFVAGKLNDDNNYIAVQYGKTTIEDVNKATIKQQYGSGLTIGTVAELNLTAQYAAVNITAIRGNAVIKQQYGSGLRIGSVNDLQLNAQYANVNITSIKGNANIKQQYNSIDIGTVGKLILTAQYANATIGTLRGDGDFSMSYNNFSIAEVGAGCRNLDISGSYANLNIAFTAGFNADFTVHKSYGGFKYGDNVKARLTNNDDDDRGSSTKDYAGKIGNGGTSIVKVSASYGSVTFK
jgi:sporulation protein YlmC with PRC-barrel domain